MGKPNYSQYMCTFLSSDLKNVIDQNFFPHLNLFIVFIFITFGVKKEKKSSFFWFAV